MMMFVSKAPSLFGAEVGCHVKDMEHYVVLYEEIIERKTTEKRKDLVEEREVEDSSTKKKDHAREHYEQRNKVTKPVSLEELFKPRSLKPGDPESEVRKVLLYGNPGSGKTCISKGIAHKWASGEIMQEFKAIYVVPIRRVNLAKSKGPQGVTLKGMIAQVCFGERSDVEYEDLLTQVEGDLDLPTTLLMFDGLDEAGDDARELVHAAEKRSCKLLILTRPYNLQRIRARVECQFECLGFNDQQLENYMNKELQQDQASGLIRSLQQDRGLWETAHTPVTAHILCSLSKQHGTSVEDRGKRATMYQIYGDMTNFVWKRFEEKPEAKMANKIAIFEDLEKIAFEALSSGQILIEQRVVERCATSTNASKFFKESGFLLLVLEGQQYQFPHLTFQEYFAGRFIARSIKNKGSDEEKKALEFIQKEKYNEKHDVTLSFAMHAFAEGRGKCALQKVLSIVDEEPVEVLGIQHFFLKMRILEATIEEANEDELKELLRDKRAIKLTEGARKLLERAMDDVLIRDIVVEKFQHLSRILDTNPKALKCPVAIIMKTLSCTNYWTQTEMKNITDALKLAKHSTEQSYIIIKFVLQQAEKTDRWCSLYERLIRLGSVAEHMPQHAGELLPTLAKECDDGRWSVRRDAMKAIGRVVAAAPQHAGELLPTLAKGCVDGDSDVRQIALEAIGRVVASAPQHAEELLPTLAKGCGDEEEHVRQAAMEAVGRVVAVSPQHAGELLPTLAKGCGDEEEHVRQAAMEAIGRVVAVSPQHAGEHLPTLAKGCGDSNDYVRQAAMEAIGRVVAAAPQHAGEHLPMLAKRCVNEDMMASNAALEAIGRVVAAAPQHAEELLPTLAKGCGDEEEHVRQAAMEAVGRVVAVSPQHAGELLPTLAKGCGDEEEHVRQAAMEAIGRVVAVSPQHAGEHLPTLAKGCGDSNDYVRRAAMDAIGRVVAAAPQHAGEHLLTLTKGCVDKVMEVRRAAIDAIGRVVVAAPQHAGEILPTLAKGCDDKHDYIRRAAMEAIGRVVAAAQQQAKELLPTVARGCVDEDRGVRRAAMEAIGRVVAAAPQHAGELLPMLAIGCDEVDEFVSDTAKTALKSMKPVEIIPMAVSFSSTSMVWLLFFFAQNSFTVEPSSESDAELDLVLHTTSSQRIGRWGRGDVDRFVGILRREFGEGIPG